MKPIRKRSPREEAKEWVLVLLLSMGIAAIVVVLIMEFELFRRLPF